MYIRLSLKQDYVNVIFSHEADMRLCCTLCRALCWVAAVMTACPCRMCAPRQLDGGHETANAQRQGSQRCCHQACMSRPRVRTCLRFGNSKSSLTPLCCLSFVCSPFFWVLSFFCSRWGTFPPYFIG